MGHRERQAEQAGLPPTHDDGRHRRRPLARPRPHAGGRPGLARKPGWGLAAGAACLLLVALVGVVPVWQWLVAYAGPEPVTAWSLLARLVVLAATGTLLVTWVRARLSGSDDPHGRP
ncbi:hypothetical protein [Nocardioides aurantiacus]|uniref:Uncharacterized protein n=1 Tax=Nocardioides aurantiacus TaxID=86796 RepID=A0A3N2CXE7_9ACTN|nr:hypothetical protein [Nocardioides aurantiacus]ROR92108.1 hypothetical protein EDD33_2992 [Nocardioides aurantiacus]